MAGTRNVYYRSAPTVAATLSGVDKTYDGTTIASPLTSHYDYSSATPMDGDNALWTPNTSASGYSAVYDTSEVGSRSVTVTDLTFNTTDTTNGNFVVRGYQPTANPLSGTGAISEAPPPSEPAQDESYSAAIRTDLIETNNEGGDRISVSQSPASPLLSSASEGTPTGLVCGMGITVPSGVNAVPVADCNKQ